MQTRKGWRKVRDTFPTFRGDYWVSDALGATVFLSHVTHCWLVSRDGRGVQAGEFDTVQAAMISAEKRA